MNPNPAPHRSTMDAYRAASTHALEESFSCSHLPSVPAKLTCPEVHPHDQGVHRVTTTRGALAEQPFSQRSGVAHQG